MAKRPLVDPPREPSPQRSDSHQIVDAIVVAAIELGANATLATIGERAGVGAASVHRYFPTLSAIFAEVSRRMFKMLLTQIRGVLADRDRPLRAIVGDVCRVAFSGSNVPLSYRRRMNLEIPLAWSQSTAEVAYREILDEVTGWLHANLRTPPDDLNARVFAAFAFIRGAVSMWLLYPDAAPSMEVLIEQSTEAAWITLGGDGASLRA